MTERPYHVYAVDGFESAHQTARSAVAAAKRGAKRRGVLYTVVVCTGGYTGAGHGREIYASIGRPVGGGR